MQQLIIPTTLSTEQKTRIQAILDEPHELSDEELTKPVESGYISALDDYDRSTATCVNDESDCIDVFRRDYYIFDTPEEALRNDEQETARRKCKLVAKRLNGDWVPDWSNRFEHKYTLYYNYEKREFRTGYSDTWQHTEWNFPTAEARDTFLRVCGPDLKLLLGVKG